MEQIAMQFWRQFALLPKIFLTNLGNGKYDSNLPRKLLPYAFINREAFLVYIPSYMYLNRHCYMLLAYPLPAFEVIGKSLSIALFYDKKYKKNEPFFFQVCNLDQMTIKTQCPGIAAITRCSLCLLQLTSFWN